MASSELQKAASIRADFQGLVVRSLLDPSDLRVIAVAPVADGDEDAVITHHKSYGII